MKRFALTGSLLAAACSVAVSPIAIADGDPEAGRQKAQPCHACHGETGHGVDPMYPVIAGQYESYLVKALRDYRAGERSNPVMAGFAANLSDRDIEDLAAWYASQDGLRVLPEAGGK